MGIFDDLKRSLQQDIKMEMNHVKRQTNVSGVERQQLFNQALGAIKTKHETFTFQYLPQNLAQLQQLPEAQLTNPFQTAALTVLALCVFPNDPNASIEMLNYLKGPQPLFTSEIQFLKERFDYCPYVATSFLEGTSPANNYTPSVPYQVKVRTQPNTNLNGDRITLFLHSSGADSDRPITLRRKGNQYFLWEQHLLSGIRQRSADDPWA